jgi:hypothetical protein
MAKLTKLAAVNIVLSNIGQAPVTRLDNDNPMVTMADNTIEEVSNSVQSEGWVFNTEYDYPFTPDSSTKKISIPDNVLQLDSEFLSPLDVIIRGGFLYDKRAHTYEFDKQLDIDVIWLFPFEDMPEAFRQYVTTRAANLFAGRSVGSAEAVKFGEREEAQARAAAMQYETTQGDYNMLGTIDNRNTVTYRPSFSSIRY